VKTLYNNKGLTGIGLMIIFITLILTALLAAVLMLYMAGGLQQEGIDRGGDAGGGSNGVAVLSVVGTDGSVGHDVEHFEVLMKLELILLNTPTSLQGLCYNESAGDTSNNAATTSDFTVEWVKKSSDYRQGILYYGELIKVRFNHHDVTPSAVSGGVGEEQKVRIEIIPRVGFVTSVPFITPSLIKDQRQPLWPKDALT
jgi:archaellin